MDIQGGLMIMVPAIYPNTKCRKSTDQLSPDDDDDYGLLRIQHLVVFIGDTAKRLIIPDIIHLRDA